MKGTQLLAGLFLLTGCTVNGQVTSDVGGVPHCAPTAGSAGGGVVVMAQSVRGAQWLPCVRQVPVGWSFGAIIPKDGESSVRFDSDRDGRAALTVLLRPSCDVGGATEVPSEQPGMRRYERVSRVSSGYGGERYYTFAGGCVTYQFNLRGSTRADGVAAISEALGFVSRDSVARQVRGSSGGRLDLDTVEQAG